MRILLISLGTRGDCEPFLGIGEILRAKGVEVICAFPEQYRKLAEDSGFPFYSLGSEFIALMDTEEGRIALGGDVKGFRKVKATMVLGKKSMPLQSLLVERQKEIFEVCKPDQVIFHPKVMYAIPWSLENHKPAITLATVPFILHKLSAEDAKQYGKLFNPLVCELTNFATAMSIKKITQKYMKTSYNISTIKKAQRQGKVIYTFSQALFKKPIYWGKNTMITGFQERNKQTHFEPSEALSDFLEGHKKILFVTFGSMTNSHPIEKTKEILRIVSKHQIPTIINCSGGGLCEVEGYDKDKVLFLESVPYDWLLHKMYATIHHGGAGTLHSSLKAGCATMAIPHAVDQPMWNEIIEKQQYGPKGISIADFCKGELESKVIELYTNPVYKQNAMKVSTFIQNENNNEQLYRFIVGEEFI